MRTRRGIARLFWLFRCLLGLTLLAGGARGQSGALHTLIVGGGPDRKDNQVAIESNVRYVGSLLPPQTDRITLFADGNPQSATVLYDVDPAAAQPGQRVLDLLLSD